MELLDRYVQAVKFWLPKAQQQDILAELSEDIRSQIEEKEAQLGGKLREAELEALLKQRGRPMLVASRYLPQQHLIGPALLRIYRFALKWILLPIFIWIAGPAVLISIADPSLGLNETVWILWRSIFFAVGILTAVLALQERHRDKIQTCNSSLNRYLDTVRFYLPKAQREDILAELSEDIQSQIEEQQSRLGRKLEKAELAAILRKRGDPVSVAEGYLPQQFLIGPNYFPFYRFALKLLLGILVPVVFVIVGPIVIFTAPTTGRALILILWDVWFAAFYLIGILTLLFALLERCQVKFELVDPWKPSSLPRVAKHEQPIPRPLSIAGVVFWAACDLWWLALPWFPKLIFGPAGGLRLAPELLRFYLPILLLGLAGLAQNCVNLVRPHWTWLRPVTRALVNGVGCVMLFFVLKAYPFAVATVPSQAKQAEAFGTFILWGVLSWVWPWMAISAIVFLFQSILYFWRRIRGRRERSGGGEWIAL